MCPYLASLPSFFFDLESDLPEPLIALVILWTVDSCVLWEVLGDFWTMGSEAVTAGAAWGVDFTKRIQSELDFFPIVGVCMWFAFKNLVSCDSDIQMIVLIDLPDGSEGVALLLMAPPDAQSSLARFLAMGTGPCWRPFETVPLGGTTITCWGWSSLSASKCSGPSSGMVGWLRDCLECLRSKTCGGWWSAGLVTYATLLSFSFQG